MKRTICISFYILALASHSAWAQDEGSTTESGGTETATGDTASGGASTGASAGGGATPPTSGSASSSSGGFSGGDYEVTDVNPALYGKVTRAEKIPEFHTVGDGDSLWNICDKYYGDPWTWPQLWAHNPTITNPHWIYPGDKIRLLGPGDARGTEGGDDPNVNVIRFASRAVVDQDSGPVFLKQHAFVDPEEYAKGGTIIGSREYRKMLTAFDQIYIEGDEKTQLDMGQEYSIYRIHRPLHNSDGEKLGYVVEILGSARVQRVNDKKVATAEIVNFINAIERGFRVGPLRKIERELPPKPAKVTLNSTIIDMFRAEGKLFADTDVVYLSHGSAKGVETGNRFLVLRQGDGEKRMAQDLERKDERFPDETIGEVLVVDARPNVSVGVLHRTKIEVRKGDKVSLRQGY